MKREIIDNFESQMSAFYTSGLLLDDGVIDPRDTRAVLAQCSVDLPRGGSQTPITIRSRRAALESHSRTGRMTS